MDINYKAILRTIIYSDFFDYPLKRNELWYFLKSPTKISKKLFIQALHNLPDSLIQIDNYYCLSNRESIIEKRLERERDSKKKKLIAIHAGSLLSTIPTVYYIGISGSLAQNNAEDKDDIDLFLIVRKNTIWTTRLLVLLLLQFSGIRRKKKCKIEKNKICVNVIIDDGHLALPEERRDIYTANEIAQLNTLFDRKQTYYRFIVANQWIKTFMPNVSGLLKEEVKEDQIYIPGITCSWLVNRLEKLCKTIQLWSINRTRTTETIRDDFLAFHPYDFRKSFLLKYTQKLKYFGLD